MTTVLFRSATTLFPVIAAVAGLLLGGCAGVPPTPERTIQDPFETRNRHSYDFNEALDRNVAKPLADAYVAVTPRFVRRGVTNFFENAAEPGYVVNSVLQGRWRSAGRGSTRFLINTTLGLLGLFDVAEAMNIEAEYRDFGQTLAGWGVTEGNYLVLPLYGPSTTRDVSDIPVAMVSNPVSWLQWSLAGPLYALNIINLRANLDEASRFRDEAALDPYLFTRSAYRQYRNDLIFEGNPPVDSLYDDWDELDLDWQVR